MAISTNTANVASGGADVLMSLTLSNGTISFNTAGTQGAAGLYAVNHRRQFAERATWRR
jgi:hypothetical protein